MTTAPTPTAPTQARTEAVEPAKLDALAEPKNVADVITKLFEMSRKHGVSWSNARLAQDAASMITALEARTLAADQARATAEAALAEAIETAGGAYLERNRLVALLASLFPSGLKSTAIEGWDPTWHGCVYIDLPTGQASWHFHESHGRLFEHLPPYAGEWDGHSTDEKYERVARAALEQKTS